MGHRERLLAGAKRCLYERGYGRTTARDIVEASGTNLASIGYHFGTKEALLDAAMMEALGDWGAELERILAQEAAGGEGPWERFEGVWERVIASFGAHRPALVASFEAFVRAEHSPELRARIAAGQEEARSWLAALFGGVEGGSDGVPERAVGSFHLALLNGLMIQWLVDPARAPSGGEMAEALRMITENAGPAERRYTPPSA